MIERFGGRKRVNFVRGKLLTVDDFQDEQKYNLESRWRHNRLLHGTGVVEGLGVAVDDADAASAVTVQPGFAIDALGREILLAEPVSIPLPQCTSGSLLLVVAEYVSREADWAPIAGDAGKKATRIEDGVRVRLAVEPCAEAVAVARLVGDVACWKVDPDFTPLRVGPG